MSFIGQLRYRYSLDTSVKEAIDSLPAAVGYFRPDGSIKLCNTAMYDLFRKLAKSDLQNFSELEDAMACCNQSAEVIKEGNVFIFPDGHAWEYSDGIVTTSEGRTYTEVLFTEVTQLYEKRQELQRQSKEMKTMYKDLVSLSGQLLEVTREQEILNMKTRLHDQMNLGITAIRQNLRQKTSSEENAEAILRFRRAIQILQEDNSTAQDRLSEFIQDAKVSGVCVNMNGKLPENEDWQDLLIEVLREACVNAARHADASEMNVTVEMAKDTLTLQITNNGRQPKEEVLPRGGLKDLGEQIRSAGGTMKICSMPEFVLIVTLPVRSKGGESDPE